jgi:TRAP-type uncharacterized transport system fused permease subunit
MMLTWKYTLPAFLVPFAFTLTPEGAGLLLQAPGTVVIWTAVTAAVGIGAFAAAFGGWILAPASAAERVLMGVAGALLLFADLRMDLAGLALTMLVLVFHWRRRPRFHAPPMRG